MLIALSAQRHWTGPNFNVQKNFQKTPKLVAEQDGNMRNDCSALYWKQNEGTFQSVRENDTKSQFERLILFYVWHLQDYKN